MSDACAGEQGKCSMAGCLLLSVYDGLFRRHVRSEIARSCSIPSLRFDAMNCKGERQLLTPEDMERVASESGLVVLGDNSNYWIEGKKHAGRLRKLETEDPSWRVHFGNLFQTVIADREYALLRVFGSIPPSADTIWEKYNASNISVDTCERSKCTGREKRVDARFQMLMSYECGRFSKWPPRRRAAWRSYCLIGGDADYSDQVRFALQSGISVDVWTWRSARSEVYRVMDSAFATMSLRYLDDVFERIGFFETLTIEQITRKAPTCKERTIVFVPSKKLRYAQLAEKVRRFHEKLRVFSYMRPSKDATFIIVVIEFELKDDRLTQIIDDAKEVVGNGNVKTWPEFLSASSIKGVHSHIREISEDVSNPDLELSHPPEREEDVSNPDLELSHPPEREEDVWIVAGKREKIKSYDCERKKLNYRNKCALKIRTEPCTEKEFCSNYNSKTGKCTYLHTPEEHVFFDTWGGRSPLKLLKKLVCVKNKKCVLDWRTCKCLHAGEPPLCKICLGTPCVGSAQGCGPTYSRAVLNVDSTMYKDLLARNYIQRK